MAWKGKDKVPGKFSDLLAPLNNAKIQQSNNPLYQVLSQIIKRSNDNIQNVDTTIQTLLGDINNIDLSIVSINGKIVLLSGLSLLTAEPITGVLLDNFPNARELLAGTGITFDDTVANERTINATAGAVLKATVSLTNTQIKALPSGAVDIVAAQGSGTRIFFVSGQIRTVFAAGAYTNVNVDAWGGFKIDTQDQSTHLTDSTGPPLTQVTNVFTNTWNSYVTFTPLQVLDLASYWGPVINLVGDVTLLDNKPLQFYIDNNGSGDFTGGNAANSMRIDVLYSVFP